ncbi:hypothetical protein LZL87_004322 [Fusarium oxysporum]|nr:hypothetical protein LZL87_004322 [Fusarium oxysporum]
MKRPVDSTPPIMLRNIPNTGSRGLNNIIDINELVAGRDDRTTIMLRNIPNKDGQPPSSNLSASLSGDSIVCFDSGWSELFGDFGMSRFDPRRKAVLISRFSSPFILTCHGKARRAVYGANMLPRTTDFGVTPDQARALHKKQHESDSKAVRFHVIVGKAEYIIDFFQPRGLRSKGKNATVFYPEGSPTVDAAQSQAAAKDAAKDVGITGHDNPCNLI